MHKEHRHFVKSYASHLNSKEKLTKSNRSNDSESVNKDDDVPITQANIVVKGQDLPTDFISPEEPPSFRVIRNPDEQIEQTAMPKRRPTTSTLNNHKK